ncbi:MAG: 3-hydroxyacyl-CoA dehydrogenase family protein [Halodesulfurarchaeum sp.]
MIPTDIQRVGVIGAGTMGYGLAIVHANAGFDVSLYDVDPDALEQATENIETGLDILVEEEYLTEEDRTAALDRIAPTTDFGEAVADADFVVEVVPERIDVKETVFSKLDEQAPSDAILATNTSGLSITDLASRVDDPERVVGTHWFNPPYVVPLVELVKAEQTDDDLVEALYDHYEAMGKVPVIVNEDIPGFIANRIQLAMDYEAWSLLSRGVASAEDIDRAVKAGFGFRIPALGVFEKADLGGLDVFHDIEEYLMSDLDRGTEPNERLSDLVEEGRLGVKSGAGVYDYTDRSQADVVEDRDRRLVSVLKLFQELG